MPQSYPVSFNQERRLAHEEASRLRRKSAGHFNIGVGFRIDAAIDAAQLTDALNAVIARHPALRAEFRPSTGMSDQAHAEALDRWRETSVCAPGLYCQHIHREVRASVIDETAQPPWDINQASPRSVLEAFATPITRVVPPNIRASLVRVSDGSQVLFVILPHLISDRHSLQILGSELRAQLAATAPTPSGQDVSDWPLDAALEHRAHHDGTLAAAEAYWLARWDEFERAQLDRCDIRFALPILRSPFTEIGTERLTLAPALSAQLKQFARSSRSSLYMVSLAALSRVLGASLGRDRVAVWSNLPNREAEGADRAIGWFVNSHMLGIDLSAVRSSGQLLEQTRRVVCEAVRHQQLSLGLLWHRQQRSPVRGVRISLDFVDRSTGGGERGASLPRVSLRGVKKAGVHLDFQIAVDRDDITCSAMYSMDLLFPYTVRQLLTRLRDTMAELMNETLRESVSVSAPGASVSR